ncbi:hypothetical protein AGMMS50289_10790 [Betaproteobacteria bacterium]|nr:hypothetical protein AGMMS50289_10790 [Betaproteobacteria bacterium]
MGCAYRDGEGVPKDQKEAVQWFRLAARQGNDEAQHNLGEACLKGEGVRKNRAQAEKWLRKAAEQGHKKAHKQLKSLAAGK